MKLKRILAGTAAVAMAAVSLPQVVSAETATLKWTYKASVLSTYEVVGEEDDDGGVGTNSLMPADVVDEAVPTAFLPVEDGSDSNYQPYIVYFDTDFDVETMPEKVKILVQYTRDYGSSTSNLTSGSVADITQEADGTYSFFAGISKDILNGENILDYSVTAFLIDGNRIAGLKVDLESDKVQTFTLKNSSPVKIVTDFPEGTDESSYYGSIDFLGSGNSDLYKWNGLDELDDTVLLPTGIEYVFRTNVYSQGKDIEYSNIDHYTVSEGDNTYNVSFPVPEEYITINLDTSELPWRPASLMTGSRVDSEYDSSYVYVHFYNDKAIISPDYLSANLYINYLSNGSSNQLTYYLPTGLKNGDTITLGTEFTGSPNMSVPSWTLHPGDNITINPGSAKDQYGHNCTVTFSGKTIPVTVTFTNVNEPDDVVYTIDTTIFNQLTFNNFSFTLPEKMKSGRYRVDISIEYSVDVEQYPNIDSPSSDTTTTTTEKPSGAPDGDTTGSTAPTTQPAPSVTTAATQPAESDAAATTTPITTTAATDTTTAVPGTTTTLPTTQPAPEPIERLSDENSGVQLVAEEGVLPEGVELNVVIGSATIGGFDHLYKLDITLLNEAGEAVQPGGEVTVMIPVSGIVFEPWENFYVYYQADDGTLTDMHATYENGYVIFTTNHFSTYILTNEKLQDEDANVNTGMTLLIIPALTAAAGVIISKKRK